MNDEQKKEFFDLASSEGVELSDEVLDSITGGYVYHDVGDAESHRKEAYYVLDDSGKIIMKLNDMGAAKHWADNLRTSPRFINTDEFEQLRRLHKPL